MPRAQDTKVWNEYLVVALRARQEQARQGFSSRQYLWRDGAAAIEAVRKDIYQFKSSGKIVGLPRTLTKCVEEECRAIIDGMEPVLPHDYVPTNTQERNLKYGGNQAHSVVSNPYHQDPYLKRIKMRGGAYAILMAMNCSETTTMTKDQLCAAAQEHCDEEMEPNFSAGRSYGAWSSKKTLISHGLMQESRTTQMGRQGQVCNGVFVYSLTRNGELFTDALLQKFPQKGVAAAVAKQVHVNQTQTSHFKSCNIPAEETKQTVKSHLSRSHLGRNCGRNAMPSMKREMKPIVPASVKSTSREYLLCLSDSDDSCMDFESFRTTQITKTAKQDWLSLSDSEDDDDQSRIENDDAIENMEVTKRPARIPAKEEPNMDALSDFTSRITLSNPGVFKPIGNLVRDKTTILHDNDPGKQAARIPTLTIVIDNRERNRNSTPRLMRMELTRHVAQSSGCLRRIWPTTLAPGKVEEDQLNYGDFSFQLRNGAHSLSTQILPVSIERKRIGDLVQRSHRADHWKQLHRMRDCCEQAILLVEGNTTKTSRFASYDKQEINDESWNPDHHLIEDEPAFYRFVGRAILSSSNLKFLQTKDEQASYRAVGAAGLVAANLQWTKHAPPVVDSSKAEVSRLHSKLKNRGVPWQIARRVAEELGSSYQLDKIYSNCEASCRFNVLVPVITNSCSNIITNERSRTFLEYGTVEGWSMAIDSAWHSKLDEPHTALRLFEEYKFLSNDRAHLLSSLHRGVPVEQALQISSKVDGGDLALTSCQKRIVRVESLPHFAHILSPDIGTETFYDSVSVDENPLGLCLPCIVMRTVCGEFQSRRLVLSILEGGCVVTRIQESLLDRPLHDSLDVAKAVAQQINVECSSFLLRLPHDRRVLIIRGLGPALDRAAKKVGYRAECKVLSDLVVAELMLRHDIVVTHALRLVQDMEMIVREFAMACFYYQSITCRVR